MLSSQFDFTRQTPVNGISPDELHGLVINPVAGLMRQPAKCRYAGSADIGRITSLSIKQR